MEVLKAVMVIICLFSGIVYVGITFSAYSKRNDKSFLGGASMLNGWWVVFPYGKNGISRVYKDLVMWGRVTIILCMVTGYFAYAIG